ncbi:MAG: alkylphosphonate utilization protein [Erysipelothrix sp.]|nr:alkylphosphonate utilization protein [Erysipelothrix sp.]
MSKMPKCPQCNSQYVYEDRNLYVCPECAHEWSSQVVEKEKVSLEKLYHDANGTQLFDGDDIIVIKDLKVKGSSSTVKQGTKVKNIKLVDSDHDIDCRIDGIGQMSLKTEFVKKA